MLRSHEIPAHIRGFGLQLPEQCGPLPLSLTLFRFALLSFKIKKKTYHAIATGQFLPDKSWGLDFIYKVVELNNIKPTPSWLPVMLNWVWSHLSESLFATKLFVTLGRRNKMGLWAPRPEIQLLLINLKKLPYAFQESTLRQKAILFPVPNWLIWDIKQFGQLFLRKSLFSPQFFKELTKRGGLYRWVFRNSEIDFKKLKVVAVWNCMGVLLGTSARGGEKLYPKKIPWELSWKLIF